VLEAVQALGSLASRTAAPSVAPPGEGSRTIDPPG
jgi:hypothetical protein